MRSKKTQIPHEVADRLPPALTGISAAVLLYLAIRSSREIPNSPWIWLIPYLAAFLLAGTVLILLLPSASKHVKPYLVRAEAWMSLPGNSIWIMISGITLVLSGALASGLDAQVADQSGFPIWLLGLLLIILSLRCPGSINRQAQITALEVVILLLTLTLGWALRVIRLESMPYVLSGDEGSAGLVGMEFVEGSRDNPLGLGWFSFPSLYFWFLSLSQAIFGRTIYAIRVVSAIAGTLTIAATYYMGKQVFNRTVALIGASIVATFHYHVFFSRIAYNNIFDGLFLCLTIATLYNGWKTNQRNPFILFGLTLGFSQYFYTTSHALPMILLLWVLWLNPSLGNLRSRLPHIFAAIIIAGAITLPLLFIYLSQPETLTFTANRVSLLDPSLLKPAAEALGMTPTGLVLEQTLVTALGLTVSELQGIYSGTGRPLLFGVTGLIFYLGFGFNLLRWRRPSSAILLITLFISILIGGLSIQAPNSQRMILLPSILALVIASFLYSLYENVEAAWPRTSRIAMVLIIGIVAWMMLENTRELFTRYFPNERYGSRNGEVTQEMVNLLRDESPNSQIYFFGGDRMQFDSIPSITYLLPGHTAESITTIGNWPLPGAVDERTIMIYLPEQQAAVSQGSSFFPEEGVIARYNRHGQVLFYAQILDPTD